MLIFSKLKNITLEEANLKPDFAVVELDAKGNILMYSERNREWFTPDIDTKEVLGKNYFTEIAPCTNNFMFQGRFEKVVAEGKFFKFDYVFTYKIAPTKVKVLLTATDTGRYFVVLKKHNNE